VTQGHSVFPSDCQCPEQRNPSGNWQFNLLPCNMGHLDGKCGLWLLSQACLSHWNSWRTFVWVTLLLHIAHFIIGGYIYQRKIS